MDKLSEAVETFISTYRERYRRVDGAINRNAPMREQVAALNSALHDATRSEGLPPPGGGGGEQDFTLSQTSPAGHGALPMPPERQGDLEGWQPIETAPLDGREVLVWGLVADSSETFPDFRPAAAPRIAYFTESRSGLSQWHGESAGAHDEYLYWRPTHWRPLPAPPHNSTGEA